MPEIEAAAKAIRRGGLVVMPTETVYGLAADATDPEAIARVFALKGRPSDNPLIVHIGSTATLDGIVTDVPDDAWTLVNRFWPGPLTLVLPRGPRIPDMVSAGLPSVAVRMPNHPVALALLAESERPLAAPSANRFMALSPTRAEDVAPEIRAGVHAVLDGGPCGIGIESTVLDLTGRIPRLLRPGGVGKGQLEALLGREIEARPVLQDEGARAAPGGYRRHYSPRTPVRLVPSVAPDEAGLALSGSPTGVRLVLPSDPAGYAAVLYAALARLDAMSVAEIAIEIPPDDPTWTAVRDRLSRMDF